MRNQRTKYKLRPPVTHLILYGIIAGLVIGISALGVLLLYDRLRDPGKSDIDRFHDLADDDFDGTIEIEPPILIPEVVLTDTNNKRTSIGDLRGKFVLLTFGFTHCPDVCPLTLSDFQRVQSQLDALTGQVQFVFISVDGARDTPAVLGEYFSFRELDSILALTGNEADVRAFGAPFGLAFEFSDEDSASGYMVNHTAGSFLLDPEGRWIWRYQFGVAPETIVAELRRLLQA